MLILIFYAFLAGIVTILSPCILPVLPIILSTTTDGTNSRRRPLGIIFGFIISFTFFTLFLSSLVRLSNISAESLRYFSILIVILLGISLISSKAQLIIEKVFSRLANKVPNFDNGGTGFTSGFIIGLSLGLLWTPCVGPILASVISLAISGQVSLTAFVITFFYALGTSIPMFAVLVGGRSIFVRVPWLISNTAKIQKGFGLLTILVGVALFYGWDRSFQVYILKKFPQYGAGLTKLEDNQNVRQYLDKLDDKPKAKSAPELIPGGQWLNSVPLSITELKGKVVLIDFWTYTCINCIRTFPYLKDWHQKYADKGLVIIGVHTPEFEFEKNVDNLSKAVKDFGLTYPIVQDNNFSTWRAYNNRYWPAKYLIDKEGGVRYTHFGEGDYDETEKMIQNLLGETGIVVDSDINNPVNQNFAQTPEIYLGYGRGDTTFISSASKEEYAKISYPKNLSKNQVAFQGEWLFSKEYAESTSGSELSLSFSSKSVYLVMNAVGGQSQVEVYLDDNLVNTIKIDGNKLYHLLDLETPGRHILKIKFTEGTTRAFAFTFG